MNRDELLTVDELAEFLKIPLSAVYRLTHTHAIPFVKLSHRALRFKKSDIDSWLQQKEVGPNGLK